MWCRGGSNRTAGVTQRRARLDARAGALLFMVDASKCTASGAGIGGGTACAPARFTVTTADASGERVREGGAKVVVTVAPASVRPGASTEQPDAPGVVVHEPVDHGDGTYACAYVVPNRGDYSVGVAVDPGGPIEGSPFPVFFAGAKPGAEEKRVVESPAALVNVSGPSPSASSGATCVIVKNLAAGVGAEHLRATFSVCGAVLDARVAGSGGQFAFVEFATPAEATKALGLGGMQIGDRTIKVELARTPKRTPIGIGIGIPIGTAEARGLPPPPPPPGLATFEGKPLPPPPPRREGAEAAPRNAGAADAVAVAARRAAEISEKLRLKTGGDGDAPGGRGRSPRRSRSRSRSRSRE